MQLPWWAKAGLVRKRIAPPDEAPVTVLRELGLWLLAWVALSIAAVPLWAVFMRGASSGGCVCGNRNCSGECAA